MSVSDDQVRGIASELDELNSGMQRAIANGDNERVTELAARIRDAAARLNRAQKPRATRPPVSPSARDVALDALAELGVPAEAKVVSRYIAARYDVDLPPSRFSSLRRDEKRAGETALTRPGIVAALDASRLTPVTGMLALSTWPLEQRLVGPRSKRVFALRVARAMLAQLEWLAQRDPDACDKVTRMAASLLATVPGALDGPWSNLKLETARSAVDAELKVLEPDDVATRRDAALRARTQLTPLQQLFGADKLHAVDEVVSR